LAHGGIANNVKVNLDWIDSEVFESEGTVHHLDGVHGILVPGGFGERGVEGKIAAATFAREHEVPYLGICLGMQMAVIESARNLANIKGAGSTEFGPCKEPLVGLLTEWKRGGIIEKRTENGDMGGTMRLGGYDAILQKGSQIHNIYGADRINERHRHRYEVNLAYEEQLAKVGMVFSAKSPDGVLPEIVEIPEHPWFIGVQFHPELKSKPFEPHPLFKSFIAAAVEQSRLV
jgi:CTP synthase